MELEDLYKKKRELLLHVVGMSYNMQEAIKIEKEIREKELILKKGEKRGDDRSRLQGM